MKLSGAQRRVLEALEDGWRGTADVFYWHEADRDGRDNGRLRLDIDGVTQPGYISDHTIYRLRDAGYVMQQHGQWRITELGRAALASEG